MKRASPLMLRRTAAAILVAIAAAPVSAHTPPPAAMHRLAHVRPHEQKLSQWCWAASTQIIMESLCGYGVPQCTQVFNRFHEKNHQISCCPDGAGANCNRPGWPEFRRYGFTFARTRHTGLEWSEVRHELLDRRAPFAYTYYTSASKDEGHMVVVIGFSSSATGERKLIVMDPALEPQLAHDGLPGDTDPQVRVIDYDNEYDPTNRIQGLHWDDFWDVARLEP